MSKPTTLQTCNLGLQYLKQHYKAENFTMLEVLIIVVAFVIMGRMIATTTDICAANLGKTPISYADSKRVAEKHDRVVVSVGNPVQPVHSLSKVDGLPAVSSQLTRNALYDVKFSDGTYTQLYYKPTVGLPLSSN